MKRYLKDYALTATKVEEAIYDCFKHKWRRKDVAYFLAEYQMKEGDDIHEVAKEIRKTIYYKPTRYLVSDLITQISYKLYFEIMDRELILRPIKYELKYDATSDKVREIGVSSIKQQIYDYLAVNACYHMFMAKIGFYQCASLKKRGQVYGKKAIERWLRKDPAGTRYFYKCDIRKYYPSVNTKKLKKFLRRDIKNDDILFVIFTLIDTYKSGLCIGSYLSQFLANYYLSYAYHYITENSFSIRRAKSGEHFRVNNLTHILFYMDDIIMFSGNLKLLKRGMNDFTRYIEDELDLTIKPNSGVSRTKVDKIDMMGFVITPKITILRKRIYKKIFRLFLRLNHRTERLSLHIARRALSYNGWLKYSNLYLFTKRYNVKAIVRQAKKVVKYYDKRNFSRETEYVQLLSA